MSPDHPRSRGVYSGTAGVRASPPGSSPLARGLLVFEAARHRYRRIIPARAGFTSLRMSPTNVRTDHPRSRGVYVTLAKGIGITSGSSPLARGLLAGRSVSKLGERIIPARAGFTCWTSRSMSRWWDHPRSRGVYGRWRRSAARSCGSSPLARGLHGDDGLDDHVLGIIPARAGFTPVGRRSRPRPWDHPRSRGVYGWRSCTAGTSSGSSPLARGLRGGGEVEGVGGRIIPARAGFTSARMGMIILRWDHPRSRGVYRPRIVSTQREWRIIPARAGFT